MGASWPSRLFSLFLVILLTFQQASAAGFVGAYVWGGTIADGRSGLARFNGSVKRVLDAGFDTVRFKIGINQASDYGLSPDPCAGRPSLGCYARAMLASPVWDSRALRRVVITTVDWSCFTYLGGNGNGCLVAGQLDANAAAIKAEYADLLAALASRFGERRILVILTNWEGDNFAYCGDSYRFALNDRGFAGACKATWPAGQTNAQRVAAMVHWSDLKAEAVGDFVASHPNGPRFRVAPEFNTYSVFKEQCPISGVCDARTDTVLSAIAAAGGRPGCSWSSYDTQGGPGGAYIAAVEQILKTCRQLFIGEGGYDLGSYSADQARSLFRAMDEIRQKPRVLGVIPWHAFDSPGAATRYGFWTSDGLPQVIDLLGPLRPTAKSPAPKSQTVAGP